jgi:hypothetical protein
MKLESLKSSKFEAFKGNELQKSIQIIGGHIYSTNTIVERSGKEYMVQDRYDSYHHCNEYFLDGTWQ